MSFGMYGDDGDEVLGYDVLGNIVTVRSRQPVRAPQGFVQPPPGRPGRPMLPPNMRQQMAPMMPMPLGAPLMQPPAWRQPQLAPGVMAPFEGLVPLQLEPSANGGVLTAAFPSITFGASPQKPFRGQRIVAVVNRSAGAGAVGVRIQGGVFVGTDLQAASFGDTPLEVFAPTAFGVDLVLAPAGPGIQYRLPVLANPAVPGGETVAVQITVLGRYIA